MDEEGIMALPQGAAMQGQEAQPYVTSMQAYDAAQTAMGMTDPEGLAALTESLRQNLAGIELSPSELATMIELFEYLSQRPAEYPALRQQLIDQDVVDAEDIPEQYDPEFLGAMLVALNELQVSQAQGAMAPMQEDPMAAMSGMAPMAMAEGGLADVASYLAAQGRNGDTMLAHITPAEARLLRSRGGSGTINPVTGLPEFFSLKKAFKSVAKAVKKVAQSPVGKIILTVGLAVALGPAGVGLSLGTAAGVASAGVTLAGGGSVKEALIAGAMGYIGGGGTVMGYNPVSAVGGFLPGAAGSALNTGLSTGLIGAGIGKLGGMSTKDALRMGVTSGLSAAALQGIDNARATPAKNAQFRADLDAAGQPAAGQAPAAAGQAPVVDASVTPGGAITAPGVEAVGPAGTIGTAQDYLGGVRAPQSATMQFAPNDPSQYYDINELIGIQPSAPAAGAPSAPASYDANYDYNKLIGIEPSSTSTTLGPSPSNMQIERDVLGMTGPVDTVRQYTTEYITDPVKNAYNEYLSPSEIQSRGVPEAEAAGTKAMDAYSARHGAAATAAGREAAYQAAYQSALPDMLATYGPLVAAGTLGAAALGAFKQEKPEEEPLYDTQYTGSDYIQDNPLQFQGGLDSSYTRPSWSTSTVVPSSAVMPSSTTGPNTFSTAIPLGGPAPVYMGGGITNSPGGVSQPYNVAGMYGVPLIYRAKGGEMSRTEFPRKTGPINGPGTGTSDDIPAMLSDGEFVFTAKAVRNAGKGSRRKGAARMYKLMKMLEGGPVKGK